MQTTTKLDNLNIPGLINLKKNRRIIYEMKLQDILGNEYNDFIDFIEKNHVLKVKTEGVRKSTVLINLIALNSILRKLYHSLCLVKLSEIVNKRLEEEFKAIEPERFFNGKSIEYKEIDVNLHQSGTNIPAVLRTMNCNDSGVLLSEAIRSGIKVISVHSTHRKNEVASEILINAPLGLPDKDEVAIVIQSL
jgi:hypothetical protein